MLDKLAAAMACTALTLTCLPALAADAAVDAPPSDAATGTDGGADGASGPGCNADLRGSFASDGMEVSCAPFLCDPTSGTCRTMCAAEVDCAPGFSCASGSCVAVSARCSADGLTSIGRDGSETSCAPYRCAGDGRCLQSCASNDDCSTGTTCSDGKTCLNPKVPVEDDGCGFGARRALTGSAFALALALVGLVTRRRR